MSSMARLGCDTTITDYDVIHNVDNNIVNCIIILLLHEHNYVRSRHPGGSAVCWDYIGLLEKAMGWLHL